MNYKYLHFYILIFFITNFSYGQELNKKAELHWNDNSTITDSYTTKVVKTPLLTNGLFDDDFLPIYTNQWEINNNLNIKSYKISNIKYKNIAVSLFYLKDLKKYPVDVKNTFFVKKARGQSYAQFKMTPLVYNNGQLKKIISFDLTYVLANTIKNKDFQTYHDSPLSSGSWYKIAIDTTGVYKIGKSFLENLGISVNSINPKNIQIFGNGGAMLPEANSSFRYDGLQENAIFVSGEQDDSFDNEDFILFYGQGADSWKQNPSNNIANHQKNIYSLKQA